MTAAGLLEAREDGVVGGLEEEDAVAQPQRLEVLEHRAQPLEVVAPATSETTAARSTFEPSWTKSSASARIILGSRLSTQK